MVMQNPVHPGAIVREDCLAELELSVSEAARRLGVGRQALSNLVNEKSGISIEMDYRLSKAFGLTSTVKPPPMAVRIRKVIPYTELKKVEK